MGNGTLSGRGLGGTIRTVTLACAGEALADQANPAAPAGDMDAARVHFEQGQEGYAKGDYDGALAAFGRAYEAWQHPAFLFNIAQCHRHLDEHTAALFFFRAYLRGVPDAANAQSVHGFMEESESWLQERSVEDVYRPRSEIYAALVPPDEGEEEDPSSEDDRRLASAPADALEPPPLGTLDPAPPNRSRWWIWTAAGVAVVGTAVAIGVASRDGDPQGSLGVLDLTGASPTSQAGQ